MLFNILDKKLFQMETDNYERKEKLQLFVVVKFHLKNILWKRRNRGGFIKDEYFSWVQYKSGPGGGPSM